MTTTNDGAESEGAANRPSALARLRSRLDWWFLSAVGVGFFLGAKLGGDFRAADDPNWTGLVPPTLGTTVTTIGLVGGLMVLGAILAIPTSTRSIGAWMLVASIFVILGYAAGAMLLPRQSAVAPTDPVPVELSAPVDLSAIAPPALLVEP